MRFFFYQCICMLVSVTCVNGGELSINPWSTNAETGISSSKNYSHAINLGGSVNHSYDSVAFSAVNISGGAVDGSAYNFSLTSSDTFGAVGGIGSNLETGFSHDIVSDMVYPTGGTMTLTLTGLVPNSSGRLTMYAIGWENGDRISLIYGDDMETPDINDENYLVNQDEYGQGNGLLVYYDYIAPASGVLNVTFQAINGGNWHFYAFSNDFTGGDPLEQKISISPWSTNFETEVSSSKVYSHAISFGGNVSPSYDGVTFSTVNNSGGFVDGEAYNFSLTSPGSFGSVGGIGSNLEIGFSHDIVSDMVYPTEGPMTLTLNNLVPGAECRMTLYSIGWENGNRTSLIYGNDGSIPGFDNTDYLVNQDEYGQGNGVLVYYDYVVPASGQFILNFKRTGDASWHFYGFSNEYKDFVAAEEGWEYELLLADNFDTDSSDINDDLDMRQIGLYAPVTYRKDSSSHSIINDALNLQGGRVELNESVTGGTIEIKYDVTVLEGASSGNWTAIRFGVDGASLGWIADAGGIGMLLRNNGEYQLFGYDAGATGGIYVNGGTYKDMFGITGTLKIVVSDIIDSIPFNGSGLINAKFYWTEDGTWGEPFATYSNADISKANKITFLDYNTGIGTNIDNLEIGIYKVPSMVTSPYPDNKATGQTVPAGKLTLGWINDPNTISVDVWFGTDLDADFTKIYEGGLTDSVEVNVTADTRYYWQVDSYVDGSSDPFEAAFEFNTIFTHGAFPSDWAYVPAGNVDLSWMNYPQKESGDPVLVDLWFGDNCDKSSSSYSKILDTEDVTAIASTSVDVGVLPPGRYYWQIDTDDGDGTSEGEVMPFIVTDKTSEWGSGIFIGGPAYYGRDYSIDELRNSGFTFAVIWTIHVMNELGDLNFNAEFPLVENGKYIGAERYPHFIDDLALLKTPPSSINRLEFGLSAGGSNTFEYIKTLVETDGTEPGSILYENFKALRENFPMVDAINFDDEKTYDSSSATQFSIMLADLGFKVTLCPYTRRTFWQTLAQDTNLSKPGAVDAVYLQCYDGGAYNNPCTWQGYFDNIPVWPGVQVDDSSIESKMTNWKNQCGIPGGWLWLYDNIGGNMSVVQNHAGMLNDIFGTEIAPLGVKGMAPSDGSADKSLPVTLSWYPDQYAASYDVFLGSTPILGLDDLLINQVDSSLNISLLNRGTTYYWAVDSINSAGVTPGKVMSFITAGTPEDLDGDRFVDGVDFAVFSSYWEQDVLIGDFDGSGKVDLADMMSLAEKWLQTVK